MGALICTHIKLILHKLKYITIMVLYSLSECENLINKYVERGGEVYTIEGGCLGLGFMVLTGQNLKTTIIKEVYINEWSCAHKVRMYNKCPKKYQEIVSKL